jgi:hypothetical protein
MSTEVQNWKIKHFMMQVSSWWIIITFCAKPSCPNPWGKLFWPITTILQYMAKVDNYRYFLKGPPWSQSTEKSLFLSQRSLPSISSSDFASVSRFYVPRLCMFSVPEPSICMFWPMYMLSILWPNKKVWASYGNVGTPSCKKETNNREINSSIQLSLSA